MKKIIAIFCIIATTAFFNIIPAFAELDSQSFTIIRNNVPLKSIINRRYNGFDYTIKNHTKQKLIIKNFIVDKGVNSQIAYENSRRKGWEAAGVTFLYGYQYAMPTMGLSLAGAVIAWPIFLGSSMFGNMGARQEARRFASASIKKEGVIKPKEKIDFKVFAEDGILPTITIILEDSEGKNYSYSNTYFGTEFAYLGTNAELKAKYEERLKKKETVEEDNTKEEEKTAKATEKKVETEKETTKKEETPVAKKNIKEDASQKAVDALNRIKEDFSTELPSEKKQSQYQMEESPVFKQYNTGVTTNPNAKMKQQVFEDNKNFVSF